MPELPGGRAGGARGQEEAQDQECPAGLDHGLKMQNMRMRPGCIWIGLQGQAMPRLFEWYQGDSHQVRWQVRKQISEAAHEQDCNQLGARGKRRQENHLVLL